FSPSGDSIASANPDRTALIFWEVATVKTIRTVHLQDGRINSIKFSRDGHILTVAHRILGAEPFGYCIRRWHVANETELNPILNQETPIRAEAFAYDNQIAATRSQDKKVRLWDVVTGAERIALRVPLTASDGSTYDANALTFSSDRRTLTA